MNWRLRMPALRCVLTGVSGCGLIFGLSFGLMGCKDLTGTPPLPAGTVSPGSVQNVKGAKDLAVATQLAFQVALGTYIPVSGLLTDELQASGRALAFSVAGTPNSTTFPDVQVDARLLDQGTDWNASFKPSTDGVYINLQQVRAYARQAIGSLAAYAPDSLKATRGHMYALLGYTEIMLADLFCSGVPLSTLDFQGGYTYQPSSTTTQVYQHAIAEFDTALTLAADSTSIVNFARVGQGRAYLALGEYAAAGQAVSGVPPTFQIVDSLLTEILNGNQCPTGNINSTDASAFTACFTLAYEASISDREGGTGLPFISSHDPRTADTTIQSSIDYSLPILFPAKYQSVNGISALVVASGVEAQLITAEAKLNAGDATGAFAILNTLRTQNPQTASLPVLTDPGTFGAEVDTLFTERAAWLFADGHRQGDLRRLIRNYVTAHNVTVVANQYPSGEYAGNGIGVYGTFIDAPIPSVELANPHFTGCLSRD